MDADDLKRQARRHGQEHLFHFWDELDAARRATLLEDVGRIDFPTVARLIEAGLDRAGEHVFDPASIEPAPTLPPPGSPSHRDLYQKAKRLGEQAIAAGRVAALTVAGGQGTRLGFDGPKGVFPISPVRHKPLFQLFAEGILATRRRFGCAMPWYIMTSPINLDATRAHFQERNFYGLPEEDVIFFVQGVMPAVSPDGKILLESKERVALSPNGHGGTLQALADCGALERMRRDGMDIVSYFQVDNPLARPVDPLFIGLHLQEEAEVSSLTVSKADDLERVGNFARIGDRIHVIEYTELPESMARLRNPDGNRKYDAANLSIFLFSRAFLERVTSGDSTEALPWHLARKRVSHVDLNTGHVVTPGEPNGVKFERFIFDAMPLAKKAVLLKSRREEVFSPVKNATGVDSADQARRDLSRRAARWLEACGVRIPVDAEGGGAIPCEIGPLLAQDEEELHQALKNREIDVTGKSLYLE